MESIKTSCYIIILVNFIIALFSLMDEMADVLFWIVIYYAVSITGVFLMKQ